MTTGNASCLWDQWLQWADLRGDREAVVHWSADAAPVRWTWQALVREAEALAQVLSGAGVARGDVCALIVRHHPRFHALYMAVSALGAVPAVLAYPNARLHPEKFLHGLRGMARRSGLDWILTERALEPTVGPVALEADTTIRGLLYPLDLPVVAAPGAPSLLQQPTPDPAAVALLQHSSGTTGLQKAVTLSHHTVLEHVREYGRVLGMGPSDRILSWLPLYHDMGLIAALHLPLALGIPVVQLDPFEWVSMPEIFLRAASDEGATVAWLPNFAYNLMADRVHQDDLDGVRLGSLRLLVNCSEPVRAESHDRFLARFQPLGLRVSVLGASYAMAETTFAATQTRPGAPARVFSAERGALAGGRVVLAGDPAVARRCVSSGHPIPGCTVQVTDEDQSPLPEGRVGELWIRSAYLFDGYRNNEEETQRAMSGGWYRSGDLGFVQEGEVFVVGRKKDLIIVAGKNLYPEDIEDAVGSVEGVLPGRVVAWGAFDDATGTEQVCVVAESEATEGADLKRLKTRIQVAGSAMDVTIARVHLVPPRWLIKSSSGKPSRKTNAERIERGEVTPREESR
ncbi:MAG: AMP-binding protein [Anaeromyxobacter sp.]|nr:AMP-binding protein [Anaeromyxobacter sp.]